MVVVVGGVLMPSSLVHQRKYQPLKKYLFSPWPSPPGAECDQM